MQGGEIANFVVGIDIAGNANTVTGTTVKRETHQARTVGIGIRNGENNVFNDVTVQHYDQGVVLTGAKNTVTESTIVGSASSAAELHPSEFGVVLNGSELMVHNTAIENAEIGIRIIPDDQSKIIGGTITKATIGVDVTESPASTSGDTHQATLAKGAGADADPESPPATIMTILQFQRWRQ